MISGVVAIVGRPNVGKSTLFNRMIGTRVSIIDDTAGVTRDRIYGKASWLTREFRVIDTGGIQLEDQPFAKEIAAQVEIAVDEANVIIMVTNGMAGVTRDDQMIARMLRKSGKPVILAVNHIDDGSQIGAIYDFYQLGLGDPLAISCLHGIGIGDLLDGVVSTLSDIQLPDYQGSIAFSLIGRPNVGKSSLVNALLHQQRVIVSNISGTTRDAIDTPFQANGIDYVCIDTAGIRKKGKVYENIEKYSVLRSLSAIERSDVVVFVLDGESGIVDQDKHVAGYAHEAGKPIVIVYNKWDTVEKDDKTADEIRSKIKDAFVYLSYAPILFVSAKSGQRVNEIFDVQEISIGDYVLTSGDLASMVLINAVSRYVKGVLGSEESTDEESFADGLLEYPHYTRPYEFEGLCVPDILIGGDHSAVAEWRKEQSILLTKKLRPDLIDRRNS